MSEGTSQDRSNDKTISSVYAPHVAQALERTQIAKYHTPGGHGFAAEDANHLNDALKGRSAEIVGTSNEVNGADRLVDGLLVQSKYFRTASETVAAAFDGGGGTYRYTGQMLEVPLDQYEQCVELMRKRIERGQVPGVNDPTQSEMIIRRGRITYKQARNIARAGNIDSLLYDAKQQAVTSGYAFAISFAVVYAHGRRRGDTFAVATKSALATALAGGAASLLTGVVSAQVLRTQAAVTGTAVVRAGVHSAVRTGFGRGLVNRVATSSLGKTVYGAAASNHVAKLLRTNAITAAVATAVTITPDFYRAAFARSISWRQFAHNSTTNLVGTAAGSAGWLAGAAAGATVGSAAPIVGTAVGGLIGGIVGALGGGYGGSTAAHAVLNRLNDGAKGKVLACVEQQTQTLAFEYLFTEEEVELIGVQASSIFTPGVITEMIELDKLSPDGKDLVLEIRRRIEPCFEAIASGRPRITLPTSDELSSEIGAIALQVDAASSHG